MEISNLETEYKFRAEQEEVLALLAALPTLAGGTLVAKGQKKVTDVYVDTPELHLAKARLALRMRRSSKGDLLGLKETGTIAAGLHVRGEIEEPGGMASRIAELPTGDIREQLLRLAGDQELQTLVTLRQERDLFDVTDAAGVVAELSLDRVSFGDGECAFGAELEAKREGCFLQLAAMARELQSRAALAPEARTKLEVALSEERLASLVARPCSDARALARQRLAKCLLPLFNAGAASLPEAVRAALTDALRELATSRSFFHPQSLALVEPHLRAATAATADAASLAASPEHIEFRKTFCALLLSEQWGSAPLTGTAAP